jgi:hypothetical protein
MFLLFYLEQIKLNCLNVQPIYLITLYTVHTVHHFVQIHQEKIIFKLKMIPNIIIYT